ncbi:MAG: hypothetical protein LBK56_08245 [Gracilibacteraceae bacterium]|nr:hypothetical protein [Gracilibacteraceae bacterium]
MTKVQALKKTGAFAGGNFRGQKLNKLFNFCLSKGYHPPERFVFDGIFAIL